MIFETQSGDVLAARYPGVFRKPLTSRLTGWLIAAAAIVLFVYGCWHVGFSFAAIVQGVHRLSWFVVLMIPPDPGTHFWIYMQALGETLAIAFLGTLLAALLAAPVSLLAARNVVPFSLIRFPVRRFLDSIRGTAKPNASAEVGHQSAVLVHLGNIACRTGRALTVNPDTEQILHDPEAGKLLTRIYRPGHWAAPSV